MRGENIKIKNDKCIWAERFFSRDQSSVLIMKSHMSNQSQLQPLMSSVVSSCLFECQVKEWSLEVLCPEGKRNGKKISLSF